MGMTSKEAARFLGITTGMVTRLCRNGTLRAVMHGRDWDISPDSVKAYKTKPKNKGGRPRIKRPN